MALLQYVLVKLCAPPDNAIKDICTNFLRLTSKAKLLLGGTCIATDNACKLVINLIFNTIIYRIYIQHYGYL